MTNPRRKVHLGIERKGDTRQRTMPPITFPQQVTLAALTLEPQSAPQIARRTGRTADSTRASLDSLQRRGLAEKVGTLWKRTSLSS